MQVVMYMKVSFWMIWLKDLEYIGAQMGANILDTGIKISKMDLVKKVGMIKVNIKDFIEMLKKKGKVNINGLMATDMLVNGKTTCFAEKDFLYGTMKNYL